MNTEAEKNNHSVIQNPNNPAYWKCRGLPDRPVDWRERVQPEVRLAKPDANRAIQLNPNNEAYRKSRQESGKKGLR